MCCAECFRKSPTGRTPREGSGISRESRAFRRSQKLADPQHHIAGVGTPFGMAPLIDLGRKVAHRLRRQGRVCWPQPLATRAMAGSAGRDTAGGIPALVQVRDLTGCRGGWLGSRRWSAPVISCYRPALGWRQLFRDVAHLRMRPAPVRIGYQLPLHVTGIKSGKARRECPISFPVHSVTGEARVLRPGIGSAQRYQLACRGEAPGRFRCYRGAGSHRHGGRPQERSETNHVHWGTGRASRRFQRRGHLGRMGTSLPQTLRILLLLPLVAGACKPPPDERTDMVLANAERGKQAIERVGCASCHTIPGIRWPEGKTGPALAGMDRRTLIAGRLPNRPDVLAAFVRNAPALMPHATMPAMPLSEREALDVAAYLYEIGA